MAIDISNLENILWGQIPAGSGFHSIEDICGVAVDSYPEDILSSQGAFLILIQMLSKGIVEMDEPGLNVRRAAGIDVNPVLVGAHPLPNQPISPPPPPEADVNALRVTLTLDSVSTDNEPAPTDEEDPVEPREVRERSGQVQTYMVTRKVTAFVRARRGAQALLDADDFDFYIHGNENSCQYEDHAVPIDPETVPTGVIVHDAESMFDEDAEEEELPDSCASCDYDCPEHDCYIDEEDQGHCYC